MEAEVGAVVDESERVRVDDGGRDGGEVVREEAVRRGAARAVDGGVVDAREPRVCARDAGAATLLSRVDH